MEPAVLAILRGPREGRTVLALHNLAATPQTVEIPAADGAAEWVDLLSGREVAGGAAHELGPYEVLWLHQA